MDKTGRDGAGMRTHWKENIKNRDRKYNNTDLILVKITFFLHHCPPHIDWQCCALQQWWERNVWNTGSEKYEMAPKEIWNRNFGEFCSKCKMTFRKVTPTAKIVNGKKFWQAQMTPWHVPSSIWVHFGLWLLIFLVKIWFSHIFPASAWSPYQSLFLRYEVEKGLRAV